MKMKGKVKSGLGEGKYWIDKAKKIFKEKYDIELYLGTLNIELENDLVLENADVLPPSSYSGELDVLVKECKVLGYRAYIVRPKNNNIKSCAHPLNVIEVVSDINFRNTYNLQDGEEITVELI